MQKTINLNYAGIDFEVLVDFTPARPAPAIDPDNYDNTLCDTGNSLEVDVLDVKVDGRSIPCDKDEFWEALEDYIVEALDEN